MGLEDKTEEKLLAFKNMQQKRLAELLGLPVKLFKKLSMCEVEQLIYFPGLDGINKAKYYEGIAPQFADPSIPIYINAT